MHTLGFLCMLMFASTCAAFLCGPYSYYCCNNWLSWSRCTCPGQQTRTREGKNCYPKSETKPCNLPFCPIHGNWQTWGEWSDCTESFSSIQTRSRVCTNPKPARGGDPCKGHLAMIRECGENHNCLAFPLRLQEPKKSPSVGTVGIYQNNTWRKACTTNWGGKEMELTCKAFGYYEEFGTNETVVNSTTSTKGHTNHKCTMLTSCSSNDDRYNFQECKVSVQLTGAKIRYGGRVEVFYQGKWGRICRDEWEIEDARVVCHQLGYKDALAVFTGSRVAAGIGPVVMSKVKCVGNESELTFCDREDGNIAGDCQNDEGGQVLCQPKGNQKVLKNEEIEMQIGTDETVRCELEAGDNYVGWFNSTGHDLVFTKGGRVEVINSTLEIKTVQLSDGGTYECRGKLSTRYYILYVNARITDASNRQDLVVDQPGVLKCMAEGKPSPLFVWKKDGKVLKAQRFKALPDGRLNVYTVQKNDSGMFNCIISQNKGTKRTTKQTKWINVSVIIPPDIMLSGPHQRKLQGENATLKCIIEEGFPKPTVEWYFKGRLLGDKETLALNSVTQREHEGNYTCIATNPGGSSNGTTFLTIDIPPKVSQDLQNKSVPVNSTFTMKCAVEGDPSPHVSWTKDGASIGNNIHLSSDNTTLSINPVTFADQGRYVCHVSNKAGKAHSVSWIDVTVAPQIYAPPENQTVIEGQAANLTCKASGVPQPGISWRFKEKDVPYGFGAIEFEGGTILQLTNTTKDMEGPYMCTARNKENSTAATANVNVLEKPTAKIIQNSHTLMKGDNLKLECIVSHEEKVTWRKDGISKIPRALIRPPNKTLVIGSVVIADSGRYSCESRNKAGEASAFVHIQVRGVSLQVYIIAGSIAGVILLVAIVAGCWYICVCRKKAADTSSSHDEPAGIEMELLQAQDTTLPWEIPLNLIHFERFIGRGEFGEVWKGLVLKPEGELGNTQVAIKCIKRTGGNEVKEALKKEIQLAKSIGENKQLNIVTFLGCVTIPDQPMLVLEYAVYGDLLGYMRKSRGIEDPYHAGERTGDKMTTYDLVMSAKDIATGMVFLHCNGIVHRDLAARNILVTEHKVCKVADFGLAIQSHKYGYGAAKKGRFPIKWTAPELLFDAGVLSSKCDVWSFGILLYEIFTMGGIPYPGWTEHQTVQALSNQYRMPKPEHLDQSLYNVMLKCWNESPDFRPACENLRKIMEEYLENNAYLELVNMSQYDEIRYSMVEDVPLKENQKEAALAGKGKSGRGGVKWSSVRF